MSSLSQRNDPSEHTKDAMGIGARINLGFAFTVALMIALTGVGLTHIHLADARLKNIVEKNNVKTEMAQIMQSALRERALNMHFIAVSDDPFLKDEVYQRFNTMGGEYTRARQSLEQLAHFQEEKAILANIKRLTRQAQPEVEKVMEMGLAGNDPQMFELIRNRTMPLQKSISDQVNGLIAFQREQTAKAVREAESLSGQARNVMLFLGSLATLLTLFIAVFVSRRVTGQAHALEHQALHDELTSLPNRALFQDYLQQAIKFANRTSSGFAILLMDLDRFKEVNDTLGHNAGDLLLVEVGRRLKQVVRSEDLVARLGGDEYVVVMKNLSEPDVERVAEKIRKVLEQPFRLGVDLVDVSASLGIACFPTHGKDAVTLTRRADMAMYAAKQEHSGFAMYSETQEQSSRATLTLRSELRHAITHDELVLHYQPKIDHHSGLVMGLEALVRWQHPKRGFLAPDQFVPEAEQAGLIGSLTRWVLAKSLMQCAALHREGLLISMAVNFSARNLHDKQLADEISSMLDRAGLKPKYLVLEITESAVMADPVFGLQILNQFDKMGVTLAIDDFGTGYSSLAYLSQLPMNEIKIDKSFVMKMMQDPQAAVIVKSTIELGHNLGLKVVAEGVESREIWDRLTQWGCDTAQGYYMSRPLPEDQLIKWLAESDWASLPRPSIAINS